MEDYTSWDPISDAAWYGDDRSFKDAGLLRKYKLTIDDYIGMLREQRNCCAICHREFVDAVKPVIDHCHTTNRVRGVLCNRCNVALGGFKDSPLYLRNALHYLTKGKNLALESDYLPDATGDTESDDSDDKVLRETPTLYTVKDLGFG